MSKLSRSFWISKTHFHPTGIICASKHPVCSLSGISGASSVFKELHPPWTCAKINTPGSSWMGSLPHLAGDNPGILTLSWWPHLPSPHSQMGEILTESLLKCVYAPVACCVSYFPHPDLEPLAHLPDLQVGITLFSWESTCQPGQGQGVPCLFACDEFPCSIETQTWSFQHPNPSFPSKGLPIWGTRAPSCQFPATRTKTPSCHLPRGEEGISSGDMQQLHWGWGRRVAVTLPNPFLLEDSQHESIIPVMGEEVDPMPTCPWKIGENNENRQSHCWAYTRRKP